MRGYLIFKKPPVPIFSTKTIPDYENCRLWVPGKKRILQNKKTCGSG
jgi:hypothetical protein